MPGHTANKCHTIRCIVQDLIDSGKLEDLEKILSIKTSPSPKYQDIPHIKNKPAQFNYLAISQPPQKWILSPLGHMNLTKVIGHLLPKLYLPTGLPHLTIIRERNEKEPWKLILSESHE